MAPHHGEATQIRPQELPHSNVQHMQNQYRNAKPHLQVRAPCKQEHTNTCDKKIETKAIAGGYNKFMVYSLLKELHAWIHNQPPPRLSRKTNKVHVLVKQAMEEQNTIGWDNLLWGRLSLKWGKAQSANLSQQKQKPGTKATHHLSVP